MVRSESAHKAGYVTLYTRMEEIREVWGREPTVNELRALAEFPLPAPSKIHLDDDSKNGRRIYHLLRQSESNRDVSLLEEAGRLLLDQALRLPPDWQSPGPPSLSLNDLPDVTYQFSPMANDPFAKVGSMKMVESKTVPRNPRATNSLESIPTQVHLKEPEHCAYPDLLVNPPERFIRASPSDPEPMRLVPPLSLLNSYRNLGQQIQPSVVAPFSKSEQTKFPVPKKSNPVKTETHRVRQSATEPKTKAKASKKQVAYSVQQTGEFQGFQGALRQAVPFINPNLSVPSWQQAYLAAPLPTTAGSHVAINTGPYQSFYSNNPNQSPSIPRSTHPATSLAMKDWLPTPSASGMNPPTIYPTIRPIPNQQPHLPTTNQPRLPQPPAIRTPTTLVTSNQQIHVEIPSLQRMPGYCRSVIAAATAAGTQNYDEVYSKAKETADNLAKMLAEK